MAPRETGNNAYAKFWGDQQRALWYVMVFSGEDKSIDRQHGRLVTWWKPRIGQVSKLYPSLVLVISNEILLQLIDRILM